MSADAWEPLDFGGPPPPPRWKGAWDHRTPEPGDGDYADYMTAREVERVRLASRTDAFPVDDTLLDSSGAPVPPVGHRDGWDVDERSLDEQVGAILEAGGTLTPEDDQPPEEPEWGGLRVLPARSAGDRATDVAWPEPEDRGSASLSALGGVAYVEDLLRPGRIVVWAAEEGSGKSYAVGGEMAIRVAVAGGEFAGTWPILKTGNVLLLSEMHGDDDFDYEATVLAALGLERAALAGRYFRLALMTAAGGPPPLAVAGWRAHITGWMRDHGVVLLIIDTATGATQVDPWGAAIQKVYSDLRAMLAEYPDLAIVLVVHCKKPAGRGARGLSDVLGEWGRWNDVTVLQENDGPGHERTMLTVRKRVKRPRRVIATKAGGLLVEPFDADGPAGPKVPAKAVLEAIAAAPGMTYADLGKAIGVAKATAARYVKDLGEQVRVVPGPDRSGPGRASRVSIASPPHIASGGGDAMGDATPGAMGPDHRLTASPPIYREAMRDAMATVEDDDPAERAKDDDAEGAATILPTDDWPYPEARA